VTVLLDSNVLIALVVADHVHHDVADNWLARSDDRFATCPITEGSLVRLLIQQGQHEGTVRSILAALSAHPRHEFWPDDIPYSDVPLGSVIGHRQVTDAYLVQLARAHKANIATLDRGLAGLHGDVVSLISIQ
jgi:toxin-antitoxin system PIN domain toxin